MATETPKLSLKLLVNKHTNKVLFAEAGKDFVDFLFGLLSLPIGSVVELLDKNEMVGSFGKLYGSVENMSPTYIVSNGDKNNLLHNRLPTASPVLNETFLLQQDPSPISPVDCYYMCSNYGKEIFHSSKGYITCNNQYVTASHRKPCSCCGCAMTREVKFEEGTIAKRRASVGERGYVKGVVTYMVMDDLVVSPMSTISSITLLNKFHVQDVGALEEKTVQMGMDEGLKLLKASFHSTTVLSDVFLLKK